jgi:hypothetical protein
MRSSTAFTKLYDCVQTRPRPEDVAELILEILDNDLSKPEKSALNRAAKNSIKRLGWAYSSMASDFSRPSGAEHQVKIATKLFNARPLTAEDCVNPEKVEEFVRRISKKISKEYGSNDFKKDRMNREKRFAAGVKKGHRWYNKRFRLLSRMEKKIQRMIRENKKYLLTRVSKSSLAVNIPFEEFKKDLNTACFIAYMSARMSTRSIFTWGKQERPYDTVADKLFKRCEKSDKTQWDIIAYVMPDDNVLSRISDEKKGQLLAEYWGILTEAADLLHESHQENDFNLDLMIVKRGNDSSTWNAVAGGWNKARESWISLLYAMKMESLLDGICPGKVLRLMAADVAYWHRARGDDLHPDTKVWAELPRPWDVVHGREQCTKQMVRETCEKHKVNPQSWFGPKLKRTPVPFKPTPELVHGVAVSSPELASVLKKAGVFSAKFLKQLDLPSFEVDRDELGFALGAKERYTAATKR